MTSLKCPKLRRFKQEPGECALAAAASVANFYNKTVDYDFVRTLSSANDGQGVYTPDIAILLNRLGFQNVTVVSADINQLDFSWQDLDRSDLVKQLKKSAKKHEDEGYREQSESYVEFLNDPDKDNELIIDRAFGDYIRKYVGMGMPILASFNWNLFFQFPKWNQSNKADPIKGDYEIHEVVIYGCDRQGVDILDSHHELYEGRLKKYRSGRYRMDWETLMTVMGFGDLIIPQEYVVANELV
jgi:hypothetical protein